MEMTSRTVQLKLYADLRSFAPAAGENVLIEPGTTVRELLHRLALPEAKAKLIFIDGAQAELSATLQGGERIGIFPPVGGG
ncbi:MAG: MoaD/ThiS family protein [Desulfobacterales bacterium]|jgi:molybdopterin converting factor small subunit|nr:MoaD/ThiS family protein [Desulfobacterales bacterium]